MNLKKQCRISLTETCEAQCRLHEQYLDNRYVHAEKAYVATVIAVEHIWVCILHTMSKHWLNADYRLTRHQRSNTLHWYFRKHVVAL